MDRQMKFFVKGYNPNKRFKGVERKETWAVIVITVILALVMAFVFTCCTEFTPFSNRYVPPEGEEITAETITHVTQEIKCIMNGKWLLKSGYLWFEPIESEVGLIDWQFKYYIFDYIKRYGLNVEKIYWEIKITLNRQYCIRRANIYLR